ncbi:MAG: NADPH-dependent 7-cyano-7-deazaguanine reductase QueF [Natronospirillum sp.]
MSKPRAPTNAATSSPLTESSLGRDTEYSQTYAPEVLFPVARAYNRATLGLTDWPWFGFDLWYAYEVSWLNSRGLPQVALAAIEVPVHSPFLIESKSLKLYLNSINMTRFGHANDVMAVLERDLSQVAGAAVKVKFYTPDDAQMASGLSSVATLLDTQDIAIEHYEVTPELLRLRSDEVVTETLYSHLLRSNCPVTGQPDWGSVVVDYTGPALDQAALLRYLVSYRNHTGFHEHCVEQVFTDVLAQGDFSQLSVRAHYLRRGGLDINPCRSLNKARPDMRRLARQ